MNLKDQPPTDANVDINLSSLVNSWLQNPNLWLCLSIALGFIFIIGLLMTLVLRKRIVLAIALIEESSKYVNSKHII